MVVADDENLEIAREFGFAALERPNEPLGSKWNDGIEFACHNLDADFVVHVGSDDWIHSSVFDRLPNPEPTMELPTPDRPTVVGRPAIEVQACRRIAFVDLATERMRLCRSERRNGVIPWIIPRAVLEPSGFRPIRDEQERGLDGALLRGLGNRPRFVFHDPTPVSCVDFKSETNLNGFDEITGALGYGNGYLDPWPLLEREFGAELTGAARELAGAVA